MAITLLSTNKIRNDCYLATIQDDSIIIGKDDASLDIYWTCSVTHNPANSAESLKTKIEATIVERDSITSDETTIKLAIKTTIESIKEVI